MMDMEKSSYTHEDRVKFMQQAAEEYYAKEIGTPPPLNRDFMNRDMGRKKTSNRIKRYSTIAAAVLIVILIGGTISMFNSSDEAYGDKGVLHRIYQSIIGIGTDQQDEIADNNPLEVFQIDSMEDIDEAVDFIGDDTLYVPKYVPKGFQFETLSLKKMGDGTFNATYIYKKGKDTLYLLEAFTGRDDQVNASGEGDMIELNDRVIYIREEDDKGEVSLDVYTENCVLQITGKITRENAIVFAKNLKLVE